MRINLFGNAFAHRYTSCTHDSFLESLQAELGPLSDTGYFDHSKCPWLVTQGRLTFPV